MARPADPQRRETILRSAAQMFLEKGYSETRLCDIAERAGIVTSTLYLYFDSKEAMVKAAVKEIHKSFSSDLFPLLSRLGSKDDAEAFVKTLMDLSVKERDLFRLWILDSGLRGVPFYNLKSPRGPMFQPTVDILTKQMDEGTLRRYDPVVLINILVNYGRWILENACMLEGEEARASFYEMCVEWLCNALFPCLPETKD